MTGSSTARRAALFLFLSLTASALLFGCARVPRLVSEYRINVQQGNVLTQEMAAQLRLGLTRDQARFILGTPMLADSFHANRWDYLFRLEDRKNNKVTTRILTLFFDAEGRLEKITGDATAGTEEELNAPAAPTEIVDLGSVEPGTPLPPDDSGSFWPQLKSFFDW
ncbi:MAG: outer membrane protein assembly factor BamE [Zoogloeaceae bacterium]|jgi:outer membrane protein assembly factor BamE|nr:outer membrane protein assembly factor BamE [Zoogloeaceae bacterium]